MLRNWTRELLLPFAPLYRFGVWIRERQLAAGGEEVVRLQWPVVSVGNLSVGGAGKTPLTIALARALRLQGLQVDVLSRGYGRKSRGVLRVEPEGTAAMYGDEPLEIARAAEVPVYVAGQRYDAGLRAERDGAGGPGGVHLLDDGFQHRQLHRDVDIVLINRKDAHDRLLPAGNLREPVRSLRRANVFAIPLEESDLEQDLRTFGCSGPVWRLRRQMDVPSVSGPVVAFCGIARPDQFFAGLESAGLRVASRIAFRDHHRFVRHDIDCVLDAARSVRATALLTTEKDRVRLGALADLIPPSFPLRTARLRVEIEDERFALRWLLGRLEEAAHARGISLGS